VLSLDKRDPPLPAPLACWLPHRPCEFTALALTSAAYRRAPLPARQLLAIAALALVLPGVAATGAR
jgi:hypothetical protein